MRQSFAVIKICFAKEPHVPCITVSQHSKTVCDRAKAECTGKAEASGAASDQPYKPCSLGALHTCELICSAQKPLHTSITSPHTGQRVQLT